jgi:hypothetical protein
MKKSILFSRLVYPLAMFGSALLSAAPATPAQPTADLGLNDQVLLVAFFRGNGESGIFLAASEDGRRFTPLNNDQAVMKPAPWTKQNLTRDPSIVYHDGKFHATWTTGWKGDCFGYAESNDLVTWSKPERVEPFGEKKPANSWAPEIFRDPAQQNFLILWSSRLDEPGNRIFSTRTTDGKKFTAAEPFLKRDYGCIDAFILREEAAQRWVMIYKNEEPEDKGGKNLRVATAPLDFSAPWDDLVDRPIIGPGSAVAAGSMTEGPTLLKIKDEYLLYWDSPLKGKKPAHLKKAGGAAEADDSFGLATSRDLLTWQDHTPELSLPRNVRHGTVFLAPRSAVGWLKK